MSDEPREPGVDLETPVTSRGGIDTFEPSSRAEPHPARRHWLLGIGLAVALLVVLIGVPLATNGKRHLADMLIDRAQARYFDGDLAGALEIIDTTVEWLPDDSMVRMTRAEYRLENQDLQGSLADYDRVIELVPDFALAYTGRSQVRQRLGRHDEAIADLEKARDLRTEDEAEPLNNLAYARAIANRDLERALAEANRAIELTGNPPNFGYIDTRGYILHLLGKQDEALVDLNQAIELEGTRRQEYLEELREHDAPDKLVALVTRQFDRTLAVLYHHRGLIHEAPGNKEQAEFDLRRGDELGYSPELGVY